MEELAKEEGAKEEGAEEEGAKEEGAEEEGAMDIMELHRWRNQGGQGGMAPQVLLVTLLAPSDYAPFNKCKDFFAVNECRKNCFGTFYYCCR